MHYSTPRKTRFHLRRPQINPSLVLFDEQASITTVKNAQGNGIRLQGHWHRIKCDSLAKIKNPTTMDWGTHSHIILEIPQTLQELDDVTYFNLTKLLLLKTREFGTTIVLDLITEDTWLRVSEPLIAIADNVIINNDRPKAIKLKQNPCRTGIHLQ